MMNSLRQYASSWIAQLLMGILVLSFAVWGVSDIFTGFRSNAVAQVGSTDISLVDFQRDYDLAVQNLGRQFGSPISQEQARQMGIPGQILGRLVSQATLDNAARQMGLGISNDTLGQKISEDPQFFGSTGTFDRNYLAQVIRSQGMTEDQFIVARRREYTRAQLAQAFAGGLVAPEAYLRAVHEFRNEERDISYVLLNAAAESEIGEPTDADLTEYFEANKSEWTAPEVRAISYVNLSPEGVARVDDVSDADAKARYDANPARFSTLEKRKIEQIVFKDRADAEQAAAALTGGKTWDALLTERSLKPADVDLGLFTKDKITDPKIAEAAFALAANAVSPIVDGAFGPVVLRVTAIEPAVVTTFDQAKADLKTEIANERAVGEISDVHDSIEDARAGGATIAEVASKYGLSVTAVAAVDANGKDLDGKTLDSLPAGLVAAAFETGVGLENDPIQPERNSYVWYEVTAVTAPRDRGLAEVRAKVVTAWKEAQRRTRLDERAVAIKTRLENKEDFTKIATEQGLTVKTALKQTRVTTPTGDLSTPALSAVFDSAKGAVAVANGAQPLTALVIVVDNITVPAFVDNAPDLAQTRQQFDGQFVNDLLGLYVAELQAKTDVKFNQVALQQVLGAIDTN